jgi:hypothetical protein
LIGGKYHPGGAAAYPKKIFFSVVEIDFLDINNLAMSTTTALDNDEIQIFTAIAESELNILNDIDKENVGNNGNIYTLNPGCLNAMTS